MVVNTSLLLTGFGGLTQRMTCSYTWGISEGLSSYRIFWTVPLFTSRPDRTSTTQSSYSSSPPPAMLMTSKWYFCVSTSVGFLEQTLHGAQIEGNYQLHSLVMSNSIHELSFCNYLSVLPKWVDLPVIQVYGATEFLPAAHHDDYSLAGCHISGH